MSFAAKFAPKGGGGGSMVAKIIRDNAIVFHISVKHEGRDAYYVLEVDKPKFKAFNTAWDSDEAMDFNDYGTILHRGFGNPSEELKAELREKYGFYEE